MTPLRPDSACCRQLNWRTDLPAGIAPEGLEALLAEQGWTNRCHHPALKVLSHAQGHEAAWVVGDMTDRAGSIFRGTVVSVSPSVLSRLLGMGGSSARMM